MSQNNEITNIAVTTTFSSLWITLASSRPDSWSSDRRSDVTTQVQHLLSLPSDSFRRYVANNWDLKCTSRLAYRRTFRLYTSALISHCRHRTVSDGDDLRSDAVFTSLCQNVAVLLTNAHRASGGDDSASSMTPAAQWAQVAIRQLKDQCGEPKDGSEQPAFIEQMAQVWFANPREGSECAAAALGTDLDPTLDWISKILQSSLQNLSSHSDLALVQPFFSKAITPSVWSETLESPLLLKVRSHPDKALGAVWGWLRVLVNGVLCSPAPKITEDWINALWPPKSTADSTNTELVVKILEAWAKSSVASAEIVAKHLVTSSSASTSTLRAVAYPILLAIAKHLYQVNDAERCKMDQLSPVIKGLVAFWTKEAKSAVGIRNSAADALAGWLMLALQTNSASAETKSLVNLYQKPVLAASTAKIKSSDVSILWGALVRQIPVDLLEATVASAISATAKSEEAGWKKGVQNILEQASSKKAVLLDGVLIVFVAVLHANNKSVPLPPAVEKVLSGGVTDPSFLFSKSVITQTSSAASCNNGTNALLLTRILPHLLDCYNQLGPKLQAKSNWTNLFRLDRGAAVKTLANFVTHPSIAASGSEVLMCQSIANNVGSIFSACVTPPSAGLINAILEQTNAACCHFDIVVADANATREGRASDPKMLNIKGQGSQNAAHRGFDASTIRHVAAAIWEYSHDKPVLTARVLILWHIGTTLRRTGNQRKALVTIVEKVMKKITNSAGSGWVEYSTTFAGEVVRLASKGQFNAKGHESSTPQRLSRSVHQAACSLLVSLGSVASQYSSDGDEPASPYIVQTFQLCVETIAPLMATSLSTTLDEVEACSKDEIHTYSTKIGTLFVPKSNEKRDEEVKKKSKGKGGVDDDDWDAAKKKGKDGSNVAGAPSTDRKAVEGQDLQRSRIRILLGGDLKLVLESIQHFSLSDIEVGNSCLSCFADPIMRSSISTCPAISMLPTVRNYCHRTLTVLASSVYEINEDYASTVAQALLIAFRKEKPSSTVPRVNTDQPRTVVALPSPCPQVARCIQEMEDFGDALSGPSFHFLFPIIQACLTGPRPPIGCDTVLEVMQRHTRMLHGDDFEKVVAQRRKDMVVSVLELLKHDRSQVFQHPSPYETLEACLQFDEQLSTGELAPLLDDRGALGKPFCRLGTMKALGVVATNNPHVFKSNPLIENRIWLNCFDENEETMQCARRTWSIFKRISVKSFESEAKPSPLFGPTLVPLLSHVDTSIAKCAARAFANALAVHPNSVSRNVEMLCKKYIESFPASASSPAVAPAPKPVAAVAKPRKQVVLPKKKAPKSALNIAGIGKARSTVKKKATMNSALLKPRTERTLDQAALNNQFKSATSKQTMEEEKDSPEKVKVRLGVLATLTECTRISSRITLEERTLKLVTSFLMAYGLADSDNMVKNAARDALRDIVASNGGSDDAIAFLLSHLETVLKTGTASESALGDLPTAKIPSDLAASDRRKEGAVVALGSVAIHLKGVENDEKIESTIDMLIEALRTPSEDVQLSVADALTKLMKKGKTQARIEDLLNNLMRTCLMGSSLAVRRGGAYGLSAAVKGSGITTLKKYDIVKKLVESCDAGGPEEKEGSLFAIELLSSRMGLLFEPYVITLLPSLLKSFSDSSDYVRKAAANTVGTIMSKLSAHGVKLVMPAVLTAFNDPAWRTKQASIHMLGAMSHLAPKQLASALPKIVPKLTEAFSDTHPKVKVSAQEALEEIKTVVKNPEISSISSILIRALTDPADNTTRALETLIATEFLHAIDAPSLALIIPILHRGLRDRGALTKRYAGLIAGNISTMISDSKDLVPYLPTLLPDLQLALLDPIPDVRSTAGKALGSLTRNLGDHVLPEIRPWLIAKLRDASCSSAERSGAAQGLAEVLIASGSSVVDDTVRKEIIPLRNHPEASTREGVMWMLTFLPPALGQGFSPLIGISLPALVDGLSDDNESVREVAFRAGRVLIRSHGKVHVDKILPSLEDGLTDDDHRIRVASLTLLGDLLSMIGGTSLVKGDGDTQDDIRKAERAQAQLALNLGSETRRRVLARLYLARSDSVHMVRQSALQVWKTVVSVTARTLRDIIGKLVSRVVEDLASGHAERTVVAGRCLGDVVSKLGDSVLPQIMPVLRNALNVGDENTKCGVCVGLSEVVKCSTKDQIIRYIEIIVKVVQDALCDDSQSVRKMASSSFQSLYSMVGSRAFDEIVPSLMVALEDTVVDERSRRRALDGLTGILSVRSRELLPYIIPRLVQRPITESHANALAGIAEVTGKSLYSLFNQIIPALLGDLAELESMVEKKNALVNCAASICMNVDSAGVNLLVGEIASKSSSDKAGLRRESCSMFEILITSRAEKADFYEQIPTMIREMVYRLNDENAEVLKANHAALSALSKKVPADELVQHVEFMRNLLASMVSDARRRKGGVGDGEFLLSGFNMPKGVEPLIPIYQRGILYGSPIIREVSASGLGEVISLTGPKFLAGPMVVKMTGPLLRIVGDRNPSNVKIAILKTLGLVLVKGGAALRAFVPQFQTTFVKALSDPSRLVRNEAIKALSLLMPLSTRVDPLIKELVAGSLGKSLSNADGLAVAAVQTATLEALATVLRKGGAKAKLPASVPSAMDAAKELVLSASDEGIRSSAAKALGETCALLGRDVTVEVINDEILPACRGGRDGKHGACCAIRRILASEVGSQFDSGLGELETAMKKLLNDDDDIVRQAAVVALLVVVCRRGDKQSGFSNNQPALLDILTNSRGSMDMQISTGRAFCAGLVLVDPSERVEAMGLSLINACLKTALKGSQKVQFAFNDVLWLALDVSNGQAGLDKYSSIAEFDTVKSMKSIHSKVLSRIKHVTTLND